MTKESKKRVEFTLPWPPSINNYYGRRKDGGVFLKPKTKKYLEYTPWLIKSKCKNIKFDGKVKVNYIFATPDKGKHDIGNLYKAIDDSIEKAGLIKNDNDIVRGDTQKYEPGTVTITVEEI